MVLFAESGAQEVVFGSAASGRSGDLAGLESMVGLFVNVLPVPVRCKRDAAVVEWLPPRVGVEQALCACYDAMIDRQRKRKPAPRFNPLPCLALVCDLEKANSHGPETNRDHFDGLVAVFCSDHQLSALPRLREGILKDRSDRLIDSP